MSGELAIATTIATSAGVAIGWFGRHFNKNGNGKHESSEIDVLLREIRDNTKALPTITERLNQYMDKGLVAMSQIERMERRDDN